LYLYMGWLLHHLDLIDHYIFHYTQTLLRNCDMYVLRFVQFNNNRKRNLGDNL
jgi:hypothetical protein